MPDIPKNAKKPEDHKAKAEAKSEPFKIEWTYSSPTADDPDATATTVFEIDREAGNDFEILEWADEIEDNPQRGVRIIRRLLGRDEYDRLKNLERDPETGRVDPERMFEFFDLLNETLGNL